MINIFIRIFFIFILILYVLFYSSSILKNKKMGVVETLGIYSENNEQELLKNNFLKISYDYFEEDFCTFLYKCESWDTLQFKINTKKNLNSFNEFLKKENYADCIESNINFNKCKSISIKVENRHSNSIFFKGNKIITLNEY